MPPEFVVFRGITVHGFEGATVDSQIGLPISIQIQRTSCMGPATGCLKMPVFAV
jgi:hypothetical protein